jgi:hypothetical protein
VSTGFDSVRIDPVGLSRVAAPPQSYGDSKATASCDGALLGKTGELRDAWDGPKYAQEAPAATI